jgi:mRNA-degrading endonuclease toxin of MazEF toxin-antitoxin module
LNLARGGVYLADLGEIGNKTVLIVSEDGINLGLREPVVARITDEPRERSIRSVVELDAGTAGLDQISYVLCHDLTTLEERDFITMLGMLPTVNLFQVEDKLRVALRL